MNQQVPNSSRAHPHAAFRTTRWSVVLDAGHADPLDAKQALEELCRAYWFPLFAFARRSGQGPDDAMDLTQSFFVDVLENSWLNRADPRRGRFRSYLLTIFRRFLNDQQKRKRAVKRGGGKPILSIHADTAEQRYRLEPIDSETAPDVFERQWAMTVLERVHQQLRDEYLKKNRSKQFDLLQKYLTGQHTISYAEAAESLGISEGNVKVVVHRLRQQFRRMLTHEVAQTVESRDQVDDELKLLLTALSKSSSVRPAG